MNDKKQQKILSYISSLKKRVEKLREEANSWEVRPKISKKIKKIDGSSRVLRAIIRIASKEELTERDKKQLIGLIKRRLSALRRHFLSVYEVIKKNPSRIWDRKIRVTEKNLEEQISAYEKILPLIFKKKSKKSKKK